MRLAGMSESQITTTDISGGGNAVSAERKL